MSETLSIAFVVEGPTDFLILKEIVAQILNGKNFVAQTFQPELSESMKIKQGEPGGWPGVYWWCRQAVEQAGGDFGDNPLFAFHDLLIVQLDADVAGAKYSDAHVSNPVPNAVLPCEESCPPPSATTNRLRDVVRNWLGGGPAPRQMVLCTPSKALETWVLVGLFPMDRIVLRKDIECRQRPGEILEGKPKDRKLVSGGKKLVEKYREVAPEVAAQWDTVKRRCSEAERFEREFKSAISQS